MMKKISLFLFLLISILAIGSIGQAGYSPIARLYDSVTGFYATITSAGALKVDGSASTQPVNLSQYLGSAVSVTNPFAMRISNGAAFVDPTQIRALTSTDTVTLAADTAPSNSPVGSVSLGNSLGKANIIKTGTLTSSATTSDQVVLTYSVSVGKTFYLLGGNMWGRLTTLSATASILGACSLELPSGTKVDTESFTNQTIEAVDRVSLPNVGEGVPVASATVIRVVCTPAAATSTLWGANLWGYEK